MPKEWPDDGTATGYLLGEMGEADEAEFEIRFLGSREAQDRIELLEAELIDLYLLGRLDPPRRRRFEERYLSHPVRGEKVKLAELCLQDTTRAQSPPAAADAPRRRGRSRERWLAAASLFFALAATYFAFDARRSRSALELAGAAVSARGSAREPHPRQPDAALSPRTRQLAFALRAGTTSRSGGELQVLAIPEGVAAVRLDLPLPGIAHPQRAYRAVIQTPDGVESWRADPLPVVVEDGTRTAFLLVPAHVLAAGDYVVAVSGRTGRGDWEDLLSFVFRVSP